MPWGVVKLSTASRCRRRTRDWGKNCPDLNSQSPILVTPAVWWLASRLLIHRGAFGETRVCPFSQQRAAIPCKGVSPLPRTLWNRWPAWKTLLAWGFVRVSRAILQPNGTKHRPCFAWIHASRIIVVARFRQRGSGEILFAFPTESDPHTIAEERAHLSYSYLTFVPWKILRGRQLRNVQRSAIHRIKKRTRFWLR